MKASNRRDSQGRIIRNSLALITQDSLEGERTIRGLAVRALRGDLENDIAHAIVEGGEFGFEVSFEEISHAINNLPSINNEIPTQRSLIGRNSKTNKNILAETLTQEYLPKGERVFEALIVVTGIKTEDALKEAGVWRGLSNLVNNEELSPYKKIFR